MAKLFDRVGQATATTGTGTVTLGAVITDATNGDLATFTDMGASAGDTVNYLIVDGNNWEIGTGALGGTGPGFTLTRTVVKSKISGTVGTTALTLSGSAKVYCTLANSLDVYFSGVISSTKTGTGYGCAFQFSPGTGTGIGVAGGYVVIANGAADSFSVGNDHIAMGSYPPDVRLNRNAAGVLALSNSTNAQTFQVYGSTDATSGTPTNYTRLSLSQSTGGVGTIATEKGGTGVAGPLVLTAPYVKVSTNTTVASLPSASTAGAGARAFVTDASSPVFGSTVAGSGAVNVPVYSDGTNWKVG